MSIHARHNATIYNHTFNQSAEFNFHNLYPVASAMTTYSTSFGILTQRPFIISHSSSPSLGHFSSFVTG